ncbi:MAG: hypothetical protein M4579_001360 [Chaenotheca gracillima]|nr:MAG: hypothetical protein M4579_001360 [Chaenotheca gracillima]
MASTEGALVPPSRDALIPPAAPPTTSSSYRSQLSRKAKQYHGRVPLVRKLPSAVVGIIALVAAVNVGIWIALGIVLAIDLMTRRLIAAGQRPVTVGMFFSLGHSTIVVITSIVVAATAAAVSDKFDSYSKIGGIIGTSVSAGFLIFLGLMNLYILYKLVQQMKKLIAARPEDDVEFKIQGAGCLFNLFKKAFKLIDRPWKMYPLGVLFGLGFDTSSEVALLGIASIQAAKGTSIWLILIFPVLFTAGMCLLDTTDGALMMTLYTSTALARDQIAILYYSIVLTIITVIVATVIGVIQMLSLILNVAEPTGRFWDGVEAAGDNYDIIGGCICASFLVFGGLSVLLYKPWRKRIDHRRQQIYGYSSAQPASVQDGQPRNDLEGSDPQAELSSSPQDLPRLIDLPSHGDGGDGKPAIDTSAQIVKGDLEGTSASQR